MTTTLLQLTENELDDRYSFISNHFNPSAGWAYDDGPGCLFETFGEEIAFVRNHDPHCVWTLLDGDNGDLYVVSGLHFVNRIGYLISREHVPQDTMIEVHIPSDREDDS